MAATRQFRSRGASGNVDPDGLFLGIARPHRVVTSSTIARWLKSVLLSAGVDTSIFTTHSVREASSSKAALSGVTLQTILTTADWSSATTLKRFYCRDDVAVVQSPLDYGTAVLSASKSRCDMELQKCNRGMAKGMQCLQAIPDCTREVKAEYHNVPPYLFSHPAIKLALVILSHQIDSFEMYCLDCHVSLVKAVHYLTNCFERPEGAAHAHRLLRKLL